MNNNNFMFNCKKLDFYFFQCSDVQMSIEIKDRLSWLSTEETQSNFTSLHLCVFVEACLNLFCVNRDFGPDLQAWSWPREA